MIGSTCNVRDLYMRQSVHKSRISILIDLMTLVSISAELAMAIAAHYVKLLPLG